MQLYFVGHLDSSLIHEWQNTEVELTNKPLFNFRLGDEIYPVDCEDIPLAEPVPTLFTSSAWKPARPLNDEECASVRIFRSGEHDVSLGACIILGKARVTLRQDARAIIVTENSHVTCHDESGVTIAGNARGVMRDRSAASVKSHAHVDSYDESRLSMYQNATADCYDQSTVSMTDQSVVTSHDIRVRVAVAKKAKVIGDYSVNPLWFCL